MPPWIHRLHLRDERVLHTLVARRRPLLDHVMRGVTHLGDAAATIGITLLLLLSGSDRLREAGWTAAVALAGSHLLVQLVKRRVARARPCMPSGIHALIQPPDRFSFPSGHAAASLSVATALAPLLPMPAAMLLMGLAMTVGVSRCYLGVHYPGDVLAGWLLAVLGIAASGFPG